MSAQPSLWKKLFTAAAFLLAGAPRSGARAPLPSQAPQGLELVHTAPTPPEADLIRQVLEQAGFHPEHVPWGHGMEGGVHVYIPDEEAAEALEFLKEYL